MTTPAPRRPSPFAIAVGNEVTKGLRQGWSERVQIIIELPLFIAWILLMGILLGNGRLIAAGGRPDWQLDSTQMSRLFLAMAAFTFAYLHVQKMFWRLIAEIQTGTLEQTYLSPLPGWVHVAVGRTVAAAAETLLVVAAMYAVTGLFIDLDFSWRADALIPVGFLLIGSAGLALFVAALTLVWKRIEILNDLILLSIMFFSGAFLPVSRLPGWGQPVARPLYLTHGIAALRTTMLEAHALPAWGTGGLIWLVTTGLGWLVAGIVAFAACERIARNQGSLTRY